VSARRIDKVLKGAKGGGLAVEELSTTVLAVNFRRARGFALPTSTAARTDHKVE
jgi:hypothetical protein